MTTPTQPNAPHLTPEQQRAAPCPLCKTDKYIGLQKVQVFGAFGERVGKGMFFCAQCELSVIPHEDPSLYIQYWNRLTDKISQTQSALEQAQKDFADECSAHKRTAERLVEMKDQLGNTNRSDTDYKKAYENEYSNHQDTMKALEQARADAQRAWGLNYSLNVQIAIVVPQRDELQAKCAKLEAAWAEMQNLVEQLWQSISSEGSTIEGYIVNVEKLTTVRQASLSTTCGQPLLDPMERMWKALMWIKDSCPGTQASEIAREALKQTK